MPRTPHVLTACVLGGACLGLASPALGASVSLVGASPPNGLVLGPQDAPYAITLAWTADITGCGVPSTTGKLVVSREGRLLESAPVAGAPPTGTQTLTVTTAVPLTYTWYAVVACPGAPGGQVQSETRTFTVQGNPARLAGSFAVRVHGTPQVWQFTPRCATGACDTQMTRPGQKPMLLRYNAAARTYAGTFAQQRVAPERICRITTRVGGTVVRTRTYKNVYGAVNGRITLSVRALGATQDGGTALVAGMVGRQTAQYRYTARGKALGCPRGSRGTAPLVATLR